MDDDAIYFMLIPIAFLFVLMMVLASNPTTQEENRKDSIACVKAGGTWDKKEQICLNK